MMRRSLVFALLLAALAAPQGAIAQEQGSCPKLEDVIPENSFLVASLSDVGAMRREAGRTALAKLWREPEMQQFLEPGIRFLRGKLAQLERQIGHPLAELFDYFQGQAGLAIVDFDPMMGMVPDMVVLVDLGDRAAAFRELHDGVLAQMEGQISVEDFGYKGVSYQAITTPIGLEVFAGYLGSALVVTTMPERMTGIIDAWTGEAASRLSASAIYRTVRGKTGGGDAFLQLFVNLEAVMNAFGDMMPPDAARMVDELGLSGVNALGFGSAFVEEGVRDSFYAHVPGEKKGLVKLAYTAPGDATKLLSYVPKNAFYASAFGIDLDEAGGIILDTLGRVEPYMLDQVLQGLGQAEDFLGLSIRDDILKPFGEEHALYLALPDGGGLVPDLVFLSKLRDSDRFLQSLGQLVTRARMMMEDKPNYQMDLRQMKVLGRTIHYIYVTHKRGDPFPLMPCCVLEGDVMAFALYPQVLKDFVARRESGGSITAGADFQRARRGLPADLTAIEYVDLQAVVRLVYGTAAPLAQMFAKFRDCPMDFGLMPRTETVAKHFFGAVSGGKADADGVAYYIYSPMGMLPLAGALAGAGAVMFMGGADETKVYEMPRRVMEPREPVAEAPAQPVPEVPAMPRPNEPVPEVPAMPRPNVRAHLEEIYFALLYHSAQSDRYAEDLGELVKSQALEDAAVLLLKGDGAPLTAPGGYKTSFVYMGAKAGTILEDSDRAVWAYERDGLGGGSRWVLFVSGVVKQVPEAEFQVLLAETRKRLAK